MRKGRVEISGDWELLTETSGTIGQEVKSAGSGQVKSLVRLRASWVSGRIPRSMSDSIVLASDVLLKDSLKPTTHFAFYAKWHLLERLMFCAFDVVW